VALRSLPIYEPAATAFVSVASQPQPSPGSQLPVAGVVEEPGDPQMDDHTKTAAATEPRSSANGSVTDGSHSRAAAEQPPHKPIWIDLRGLRLLAPTAVSSRALPHSFVAAESAGAEQVLTELLGVRRISEAEIYRCANLCFSKFSDKKQLRHDPLYPASQVQNRTRMQSSCMLYIQHGHGLI